MPLRPELYEHLNPMPFEAAVQMELELAEHLRAAGCTHMAAERDLLGQAIFQDLARLKVASDIKSLVLPKVRASSRKANEMLWISGQEVAKLKLLPGIIYA